MANKSQDKRRLDPEEFLLDVIEEFGGPREYAKTLVQEFHTAKEGGMARQRILEMINRVAMQIDAKRPKQNEVLDMTDAELMAAAKLVTDGKDAKEEKKPAA